MEPMNHPEQPETEKKPLNRQQLIMIAVAAAVVLLACGFAYQSWQISRLREQNASSVLDAGTGAPSGAVSAEKIALIKEILRLNDTLDDKALAELSEEELEQLRAAGAPGMPIGLSTAAFAVEEFAGTLEIDAITWDGEAQLGENPPYYQIHLHHVSLGDFHYKVDAFTGDILSGMENILQTEGYPVQTPDGSPPLNSPVSSPSNADVSGNSDVPNGINRVHALKNALYDAGLSEEDTEYSNVQLEYDDGLPEYKVEFYADGVKYEYKIDAYTGGVLQSKQESGYTPPAPAQNTLTAEQAASIAYADAGVKADSVSNLQTKLDWEGNIQVFEIEFVCDGTKYEYELNAADGAIRKSEQKTAPQTSGNPSASGQPESYTFIGDAAAKEIAFQHAGVRAGDVRELEFELDREHGLYFYKIEFTVGSRDYEYEVDAVTGMVMKAEAD